MGSTAPDPGAVTAVANRTTSADLGPLQRLLTEHYGELRRMAHAIAARERDRGLCPTDLVHEAYLRLLQNDAVTAKGRVYFLACFANQCRWLLVEQARTRQRQPLHETLCSSLGLMDRQDIGVVELHEAIESLGSHSERMARIVDMRLFGVLSIDECAEALGVSPRTIDTEWSFAKAWLRREFKTR